MAHFTFFSTSLVPLRPTFLLFRSYELSISHSSASIILACASERIAGLKKPITAPAFTGLGLTHCERGQKWPVKQSRGVACILVQLRQYQPTANQCLTNSPACHRRCFIRCILNTLWAPVKCNCFAVISRNLPGSWNHSRRSYKSAATSRMRPSAPHHCFCVWCLVVIGLPFSLPIRSDLPRRITVS